MKEDKGSLTIRINGGGPIGSVVAVSDSGGNVRGYVENPFVELPLRSDGKLNVGGAVGRDGMVTVSRDIGLKEPYIGSTALVSGEIAEDMTAYLTESEQVPSACALGVLVGTDRSIKAAGGFIVQLMPGADSALIDKLEENIFMMDQLTTILDEDGDEAVFAQVLRGFDFHLVAEQPICYRCGCSRERVEAALSVIDSAELEEMIAEGKDFDIDCQFCDKSYRITGDDLRRILKNRGEKIG
jgi:molecular chaperone Hsp33